MLISAIDDYDLEKEYEEDVNDDTDKYYDLVSDDEEIIVPEEEMKALKEENQKEKHLALVPANDRLTYYFDKDFIDGYKREFRKRSNELSRRNLPYWNL